MGPASLVPTCLERGRRWPVEGSTPLSTRLDLPWHDVARQVQDQYLHTGLGGIPNVYLMWVPNVYYLLIYSYII